MAELTEYALANDAKNVDSSREVPALPLLTTKIYRPAIPKDILPRFRLTDQLDNWQERPLTLVSAPAGYGKSILASRWLESCGCASAWVSLDENDNNLRLFVKYLLAAVEEVFPGAGRKTGPLVDGLNLPPPTVLGRALLNDLDEVDEKFILVLDDYQTIHDESIHDLLTELFAHPPLTLHIALLTRRDPPLPLSRMRANGQLAEITAEDLRFNREETAAYLEKSLETAINPKIAAMLEEKTEGWITGLRLATLSLRYQKDIERSVREMTGRHHQISEYLAQEVVAHQPPGMQRFLVETSVLDRFCAPLCEEIHGGLGPEEKEGSGQEFIEWLEKTNLFVIPLDLDHYWFRYHHLFQDILKNELSNRLQPTEIKKLHLKASRWFADHIFVDEAVNHALAADDLRFAVQVVERNRYLPMNSEQWYRLERWLELLPPEAREKSPLLSSAYAYLLEYCGQMDFVVQRDKAESLLSALPPDASDAEIVRGEVAVLKGEQAIIMGQLESAVEFAGEAAKLVPSEATHLHSIIVATLAVGNQGRGHFERGLKILDDAGNSAAARNGTFRAKLLAWRCLAHMMEGTLEGVLHAALQCLELGKSLELPESKGLARYFLGVTHYLRNQLSEAERYLAELIEDGYTCRQHYVQHGACALASIYAVYGRLNDAADVMKTVKEQMADSDNQQAMGLLSAFEVDLALGQGRYEEAQIKSSVADFDQFPPIWFFFVPQLTPIKLLLTRGSAADLDQALTELSGLDNSLRSLNRNTIRISVLLLQALVYDAKEDVPSAFEKLYEALPLGARGGNLRSFVDLGPRIAELLRKLPENDDHAAYVQQILTAFEEAEEVEENIVNLALVEPLTNRERDILACLAKRLQNKEIADELFISVETVKSHLKNIYQKLGVGGRRDAIIRASELGILVRT